MEFNRNRPCLSAFFGIVINGTDHHSGSIVVFRGQRKVIGNYSIDDQGLDLIAELGIMFMPAGVGDVFQPYIESLIVFAVLTFIEMVIV